MNINIVLHERYFASSSSNLLFRWYFIFVVLISDKYLNEKNIGSKSVALERWRYQKNRVSLSTHIRCA